MKKLWMIVLLFTIPVSYGQSQNNKNYLQEKIAKIEFVDAPLIKVVEHLEKVTGAKIAIDCFFVNPEEKVTVVGKNLTLEEILAKISAKYNFDCYMGSKEDAKTFKKLYDTKLVLDFLEAPPLEIIDFLRTTTGINILVHPKALKKLEKIESMGGCICIEAPMRVYQCLMLLGFFWEVSYTLQDGVVIIQEQNIHIKEG